MTALLAIASLVALPGPAGASQQAPPCSAGLVSLTFDDGPSPTMTPRLVRILRRAHAPATFFMVGARVASAPATARLVARSGLLVANHGYAHADMTGQSRAQIRSTLGATDRALRSRGIAPIRVMRPPYGAINDRVRGAVRSMGLAPVLWDVDPRDWAGGSAATIAASILAQLRPHRSNIVLQHDGVQNSPASIAAVPRVIAEARRRGYCFVGLNDRGQPGFPVPTADLTVTETAEGGAATISVKLSRYTARTTTLRLRTRGRTAHAGSDFTRRDVVLRLPAGDTRAQVSIPVARDGLDEPTERLDVVLSQPDGVILGTDHGVVLITDRDRPSGVSGVDRDVVEPVGDPVTRNVRLRLGRVSWRPAHLLVKTVAGSATPGDYEPFRRWVAIPAGRTSVRVPLTVYADEIDEPDESFAVRIVRATHARMVKPDATITIAAPPPETPPEPPPTSLTQSPVARDGALLG